MTEKTITLTTVNADGQPVQTEVGLSYCFATEIGYRDLAGEDISDFMQEAAVSLGSDTPRMPDVKKSIFAILAAALAYSQAKGIDLPVRDTDLMNHATPQEVALALGTVMGLRTQFYHVPSGEPEDKPEPDGKKGKDKRKNA